jgi:hypothetical protein
LSAGLPSGAAAQVRASERASISQMIGSTVITLKYSRPVARGRELFGGVVRWGSSGATLRMHWGTTIVPMDIEVNPARPFAPNETAARSEVRGRSVKAPAPAR